MLRILKYTISSILAVILVFTYWYVEVNGTDDVKFNHIEINDISLNYEDGIVTSDIIPIIDNLEDVPSAYFGEHFKKHLPLRIYILNSEESYNKLVHRIPNATLVETEGIYFLNRIILNGSSQYFSLDRLLLHEYAHYMLDEVCFELGIREGSLPQWFREGFSEYVSRKELNDIPQSLSKGIELIDLGKLTKNERFHEIINSYEISYIFLNDMMVRFGTGVVEDIMIDLASTKNFNESFYNITNIPLEQYHESIELSLLVTKRK
ncbi:hypothetical protein [Robertmurraya andreesenii]|uniref:Peptidase MA-like domain-containing protein n=1 Tax=Anoxybacillus andreesenii TaxID=1325932 RepID=A0ABT9UYN2_9BACL|nr:hypothetical protein [Robertmurraya andreesenii]MDQ0153808.1 hypothetical protein [Robertmurraya andreesenii]